jgi:hypothetical protein
VQQGTRRVAERGGTQFSCFTGTKVQILTLQQVKSLKHKLFRAENTRRKLHNELQVPPLIEP